MVKVLIIEDDPLLVKLYASAVISAGYETTIVLNGQEGLKRILEGGWGLILLDIMLPGMDGLVVLSELKTKQPQSPNGHIVVLSNIADEEIGKKAINLGAFECVDKSKMTAHEVAEKIQVWIK